LLITKSYTTFKIVFLDSQKKALPMSLFQPSSTQNILSQQDTDQVQRAYKNTAKVFS
jgi:hypothetical protein